MKEKTKLKLERRWLSLPVHHIDTSVIMEAFSEDGKYREECKSYLNQSGYKFIMNISLTVFGELLVVIDDKEKEVKELFVGWLHQMMRRKRMKVSVPTFEILDTIKSLREFDYKVEFIDSLHLATAIEKNADAFVTLDEKLVDNSVIEKQFRIKIWHPKQF